MYFISSVVSAILYISSDRLFKEKIKKDGYVEKNSSNKKLLSLFKNSFCILCPVVNVSVAFNYYVIVNLDSFYDEYKNILIEKGKITKKDIVKNNNNINKKDNIKEQILRDEDKNSINNKKELSVTQKVAYLKAEKNRISSSYNDYQKKYRNVKVKSNIKKIKK